VVNVDGFFPVKLGYYYGRKKQRFRIFLKSLSILRIWQKRFKEDPNHAQRDGGSTKGRAYNRGTIMEGRWQTSRVALTLQENVNSADQRRKAY
jgi:hypothetical protein